MDDNNVFSRLEQQYVELYLKSLEVAENNAKRFIPVLLKYSGEEDLKPIVNESLKALRFSINEINQIRNGNIKTIEEKQINRLTDSVQDTIRRFIDEIN